MKRNKFSLSHYKLLSCDMGELIPIGCVEVLPGDTIQHATSLLVRASPLLSPVMHPVHVRVHHFFVPNRLIWDDWEDFITGGPDGMNTSVYPNRNFVNSDLDLLNYFGVPAGANVSISMLPIRAYNLIWNEYYRDQDLQAERVVAKNSGTDATSTFTLANVNWEKDYFTSARPWEQKGPAITVPLGTSAPVNARLRNTPATITAQPGGSGTPGYLTTPNTTGYAGDPFSFTADLTGASAVTVNVLREAMALQRYEEARARYGSRYTEYLRYLGVRSSDARLQRPEYLGGGKQTIQFSEVLQTAEGTNPVGQLAGHGIAAMRSNRYRRFFEEHGLIISLLSVRPKTIYFQGLDRMWRRTTKEDYWQRELEHIGQQEVYNREVYVGHATPDGVFGYQDRYDEYRRVESGVAGEFRTSLLNFWHMARDFSSSPALNSSFVSCVPTERTFAVPSKDVLYIMANHSIQARRQVAQNGRSYIF